MKIHRGEIDYSVLRQNAVTIGTFDGVHSAHRAIIDRVKQHAEEEECESVLITFEPHPRSVIYPKDTTLKLLTNLDEKLKLLESTGLDHVVVFPFSVEFSQMSAEEYVESFLIGKFNPKVIVVGYDHQFGLNRTGDINLLQDYSERFDFKVVEISEKVSNDVKISSTSIRTHLLNGGLRAANSLLGYRYSLKGNVVKGDNIGTSLGYPTANINVGSKQKLIPKTGIYAAFVHIEDMCFEGLLYIGKKPSVVDTETIFIEVNLRNFSGYLYGEDLKIELVDYIRDDEKFTTKEALISRIQQDERVIASILEEEKPNSF